MMKQKWVRPQAMVQVFTPNEYVAICWNVACSNNTTYNNRTSNAPDSSKWAGVTEGPYDQWFSHAGDCTNSAKNYFRDDDGVVSFVKESNSAQGDLGGAYTGYTDNNGDGKLDAGDTVYWYTSNGTRTWLHWGTAETANSAHPNRS